MSRKARFYRSCVDWPKAKVGALEALLDGAATISPQTFSQATDAADRAAVYASLGFGRCNPIMREHAAGSVEFGSGKVFGRRAYFMRHSRIEYIFLRPAKEASR
ncbi:MAG: hypothetical protein ACE37J_11925 [Pikeienuella sp.]|uniref:hypothetical protein n=1 Tax=Pikeienuella sp. TaxID=2831957 RepID=UPI00391E0342